MVASRVSLWAPVLVWAGVIFAFSSIPGLSTDLGTWDLVLRKLAHLVEYAILGVLLYRALLHEPAAVTLGVAYAASDEFHQAFVRDRDASPLDWALDSVGVAAGIVLFLQARKRR